MYWLRLASIITLTSLLPAGLFAADNSSDRYDYQEVLELLKSQLSDLSAEDLESAAAVGLIKELEPRVRLVVEEKQESGSTNAIHVSVFKVYEDHYGYVRLADFHPGMAQESLAKLHQLVATNQLHGLVMDLRFAGGESYADAAQVADSFYETKEPLINWGQGLEHSTVKTNALDLPVAVLINRETKAAGEALAAILRTGNVGLLIGTKTAGQASMYKEFELATGQHLRIATNPIQVGADVNLSTTGVAPDIQVAASPIQEKLWLKDPYKALTVSASAETNAGNQTAEEATPRRHLNEADLVRMLREGEIPDFSAIPAGDESVVTKPVIRDPALARALDFLKGLALVRKFRSI